MHNVTRFEITLLNADYYWAVQAFNGLDGPLSAIASFHVCILIDPGY